MQKNTNISERISQVIKFYGVTKNQFGAKLGYTRSQSVYDIIEGKSKPSYDFFLKFINSEYSEKINAEWLISGNGEMLKQKNNANIIAGRDVMSNSHNRTSVSTEEDATDKDMIIKNLQSEINSKDTIIKMLIEKIK